MCDTVGTKANTATLTANAVSLTGPGRPDH
jgi:hypothetical protein